MMQRQGMSLPARRQGERHGAYYGRCAEAWLRRPADEADLPLRPDVIRLMPEAQRHTVVAENA